MDEGIRPGLNAKNPPDRELRDFGLILGGLLALLAFLAWQRGSAKAPWELGAAALSAAAALICPAAMAPLHLALRLWGKLNTFLIMFLFYFLIITPYALLLRLFGVSLLDLKLKTSDSYWKIKEPSEGLKTYERQF